MAYVLALSSATPLNTDPVSAGAGNIRDTKGAIIERLATAFVDLNADPLVLKAALVSPTINSGSLTFSAAVSKVVPGATSLSFRNNADSADNLIITNAGAVTIRAGLAMGGALSGVTTLGLSGMITTTKTGNFLLFSQAATTSEFLRLTSTGADVLFGAESSTGGGVFTGSAAYAAVVGTNNGTVLQLFTNNTLAVSLDGSTQDATLSAKLKFSTAVSKIIPGATSISHRNNADSADNLLISDAGLVSVRAGLTLTTGSLTFGTAVSKIIPGATSISHRNNADSADNLIITDAGAITVRSSISGVTTLTATTLAGTLSTAAQGNVTSLGTLTSLTVSGASGFGGAATNPNFVVIATSVAGLTGGTAVQLIGTGGTIPSSVTSNLSILSSNGLSTAASAFTLSTFSTIQCVNVSLGAGSAITDQYGLQVMALSSGTRNWPIYCASITAGAGGVTFRDSALATGATGGHLFIPTSAGAPTGVPAVIPLGQVAFQYDATNNKLYVYNGAWKSTAALT